MQTDIWKERKRNDLHAQFTEAYWEFHQRVTGFKPDLTKAEWQALRLLKDHFEKQCGLEMALTNWVILLVNYDNWPKGAKSWIRPSDIRRGLSNIVAHLKNGKKSAETQVSTILNRIHEKRIGQG